MYQPCSGDIVLLEVETDSWHQPKKQQYLLIISNNTFHEYVEMAVVCPIVQGGSDSPVHINCAEQTNTNGVIYCEQVKTIDLKTRSLQFVEKVPQDLLDDARDILYGIIEKEE
ncbi:type II toxin-antitoxin system PemK/MazF family toxin [Gracilibacillus oryzae]|uniref:Type II toxin-antitoxin system PemK/MazF family toxin n=1 Tax=Gracilibacillus oryzae TaxID=1672701 RepID=A0A7C8KWX0_9BACI|nr:type II toxin-antitoxin system PemK/MazF family toxin [Gracilibacillus oryzae]KAB8128316.1 type II toxin-antitoxin system PemK/MazF family toxin [Gracilibacillus oryzae]